MLKAIFLLWLPCWTPRLTESATPSSVLGSPGTPGPPPTPVSRLPFNTGFNSMYPTIPQPIGTMADTYR